MSAIESQQKEAGTRTPEAEILDMNALYEETFKNLKEGSTMMGTVVAIQQDAVVVDVGYKSEGLIPIDEFTSAEMTELKVGDEVGFGWHWQGKSAASMKRFAGHVTSLEDVTVRAGTYRAAVIEGTWSYLENGEFRARAHERFWFAPGVSQVVKIVRSGMAPDEGSRQIDAELADYR